MTREKSMSDKLIELTELGLIEPSDAIGDFRMPTARVYVPLTLSYNTGEPYRRSRPRGMICSCGQASVAEQSVMIDRMSERLDRVERAIGLIRTEA